MPHASRLPWTIVAAAVLLMAVGCLAIARAEEIADIPAGAAMRQMRWTAAAIVLMLALVGPNYRQTIRWAYWLWGATVVALLAVYLFGPVNGAHRWIRLGPVGFQPSEFAKPVVILALARYLMYRDLTRSWLALGAPLVLALVPAWLVLKEPDLGTSLVFTPVLLAMLYAAGAPRRRLALIVLLGLAATPLLWRHMSRDQRSRVTALWQQNTPDQPPSAAGYHLFEAKRMFARGGFFGSSLDSHPDSEDAIADRVVPEPHTDSIFCVVGERWGIAGSVVVLSLYTLLLWRGLRIAEETAEPLGKLIVVGVMTMIGFQTIVNTAMLVGLAPITGLPLPLMSYGGSELLATAAGLGLVLNVAARPGYELAG